VTTPMAISNRVRQSATVPVSNSSNERNITLRPGPGKAKQSYVLKVIEMKNRENEPVKEFRSATVAGNPLMGAPVAASTSGTRGETPIFLVEFWIRAMLFRVLIIRCILYQCRSEVQKKNSTKLCSHSGCKARFHTHNVGVDILDPVIDVGIDILDPVIDGVSKLLQFIQNGFRPCDLGEIFNLG